jgi:hypothetical protein
MISTCARETLSILKATKKRQIDGTNINVTQNKQLLKRTADLPEVENDIVNQVLDLEESFFFG